MRVKPEMELWVHTDKSGLSSAGAAQPQRKANTCSVTIVPTALIMRLNFDAVALVN